MQSIAGPGNLTLDGASVRRGVVRLGVAGDPASFVVITSTGNDSGRSFAISGTDAAGNPYPTAEVVTGANAGMAISARTYLTVTQISIDGATAGQVAVGSTPNAQQIAFARSWTLDYSRQNFNQLNEASLGEAAGIGGNPFNVVQIGPVLDAAGRAIPAGFVDEAGPILWDGTPNTSPPRDINFLGDANLDGNITTADARRDLLNPAIDWNRLQYRFDGTAADGVHPDFHRNELNVRELQRLLRFHACDQHSHDWQPAIPGRGRAAVRDQRYHLQPFGHGRSIRR